ncbi:MAG: hypothetical protein U0Z44_06715 [Kouleothrix sp.]
MKQVTPFDSMAADYDQAFTDTLIGARMRQAVWRRSMWPSPRRACARAELRHRRCTWRGAAYTWPKAGHRYPMPGWLWRAIPSAGLHELVQVEQLGTRTSKVEHAAGPRHFDGARSRTLAG